MGSAVPSGSYDFVGPASRAGSIELVANLCEEVSPINVLRTWISILVVSPSEVVSISGVQLQGVILIENSVRD